MEFFKQSKVNVTVLKAKSSNYERSQYRASSHNDEYYTIKQNRSKMDHFERRGCRWFQLFFIDFQLFYFLTRIISEKYMSMKIQEFPAVSYSYYFSAISWRPVLVVEEARVPGENHRPWVSNW
jgi:hypothetical protein